MSEKTGAPSWIGPVLGAIILIGGYVAYQQWHEKDEHQKQCVALQRSFVSNFNSMSSPTNEAIKQAQANGDKSGFAQPSLVAGAAAGEGITATLVDKI